MGLTKEYLRYVSAGIGNIVASASSNLCCLSEQIFAVGACENVIIWNIRTGEKVGVLFGSKLVLVSVLKYHPANNHLAVGYSDGSLKIFNVGQPEEPLVVFSGHKSAISTLCFSDNALTVATGGKDTAVVVWDVVNECGLYRLNGHKGPITALRFAVTGKYLISSSKDSFVKFWDLSSQHCFYTIADHRTEVWDLALIKNDSLLITGSAELELRVYGLKWLKETELIKDENQVLAENEESSKKLPKIEFDGREGLSLTDEDQDLLLCKRLGSLLRQCKGRVTELSVSRDEKIMICQGTGSMLDVYRIFDRDETRKRIERKTKKAEKRRKAEKGDDVHLSSAVSADLSTQFLRLGGLNLSVKSKSLDFIPFYGRDGVFKLAVLLCNNSVEEVEVSEDAKGIGTSVSECLKSAGHRSPMRCVCFSHDNACMLSGGQDGLKLWSRNSVLCLRTFQCSDVLSALFVPGDRHCVAGTKSGMLCLFDVGSGDCLEKPKGHDGAIWSLTLASDDKSFVSCGADKKVKFWNFDLISENGRSRLTLVNTRRLEVSDEALCVGLSGNGKFLAVGLLDNTAKVFFVDTLKFFLSLYGHSLPVLCLDMSSDSRLIVTGSADKNVKIWGLDFGDCHKSLFAHDDSVTCLRFLPKTHLFFSAGKDGKIKQWDADKFQRIQVLTGHHMEIWGLGLSKTGSFLVSSSHDRTIRLWERSEELVVLEEEEEIEREKEYEKGLTEQEDLVAGESQGEAELASKKTVDTVKSTEAVIEAVDICRSERAEEHRDPPHSQHPMIAALGSSCLDYFLLDMLRNIPSSDLEKCLLVVPFGYVLDVLKSLVVCVERKYQIELACRVIFFLLRVNHNQLVNAAEAVPILDKLRAVVPSRLSHARDMVGVNLAALKFIQMDLEDREDVQLFAEAYERSEAKKKKRRKQAFVMSVS